MVSNRNNAKYARIVELRNLFLKTGTRESLVARCKQWGVSNTTINNYIQEVYEDFKRIEDARQKYNHRFP